VAKAKGGPHPDPWPAVASAEDIYSLGEEVSVGVQGVALLAPQAEGQRLYPQRFFAPLEQKRALPRFGNRVGLVGGLVGRGSPAAGGSPHEADRAHRVFPKALAFPSNLPSRNPRRYGGVMGSAAP